jgi:hypothetical protein
MAKKKKKSKDDDELKRKKKRRRDEDDEDLDAEDSIDDEPEEDPLKPRRRQDLFVGMATLALFALIGASVFFYMDADEVSQLGEDKKLGNPTFTIPTMSYVNKNIK